jgi:predicted kinase
MRKTKLLMLKGLPASGKTTFAVEWVKEDPLHRVRVNRDDLRKMCGMVTYNRDIERFVNGMQYTMVYEALEHGMSVVLDDTNFSPHRETQYKEVAEKTEAEFEIKFFDVPVKECLRRNATRPAPVPEKVITDMWYKHVFERTYPVAIMDVSLPPAIICDIDGTLAWNNGHRGWFEEDKVGADGVRWEVRRAVEALRVSYVPSGTLIFLSGRSEKCRDLTFEWLKYACAWWLTDENHRLYMRKEGDTRADHIVKREIYENHIKDKYNILAVFDDRPSVCDMWRELRLPLFDVGPNIPF